MISEQEYLKAKAIVDEYEANKKAEYLERTKAFREDLTEYFKNTTVEGTQVHRFSLAINEGYIIPENPVMDECYCGDNDEDIEALCKKHNVDFKFPYWMYPK